MGAYGIMRSPLNQPYNLELQIYRETHGISQLESKQWGYTSSGQKDWEVVYPVSFSDHGIPIVSKVGSSATSTDVGIIGEKEKLYVHISEMITTLQGIYWIAIGK